MTDGVEDVAERQHGLITVAQLQDLGITRSMLRRRLDRGQWLLPVAGVLRIAGAPITWESRLLVHVLAAGEGAVASHRAAAALWNLDGYSPGIVEITIPRGRWYRPQGLIVHSSMDLCRVQVVRRNAIPATPLDRTLLDLGAVTGIRQVKVAIDNARRRRLTTWDRLLDTLVTHARRGRDGVGKLRAVLDEHYGETAVTDSAFERLVVSLLVEAGLPTPILQHEVSFGGRRYRIDLAYPAAMLAIELDGSVHLERAVWEADHCRQNALSLAGWRVLRFTWRDYMTRRVHLIQEIRVALNRNCVAGGS